MSSHHFVTEGQSDGLYIIGTHIDVSLLSELLEWNPMVIAAAAVVPWLVSLGIKIDVVVADQLPEDLPYMAEVWPEPDVAQKLTATAARKGMGRLALCGPADTAVAPLLNAYSGLPGTAVIYSGNRRYFGVDSGKVYRKWGASGFQFGVWPENVAVVEGPVEPDGNGFRMKAEGFFTIQAREDIILYESL